MIAKGFVDAECTCSASSRRTIAGVAFARRAIVRSFSSTISGSRIAGRQNSTRFSTIVVTAPQNHVQMRNGCVRTMYFQKKRRYDRAVMM